jgi:hypothetical protein
LGANRFMLVLYPPYELHEDDNSRTREDKERPDMWQQVR